VITLPARESRVERVQRGGAERFGHSAV